MGKIKAKQKTLLKKQNADSRAGNFPTVQVEPGKTYEYLKVLEDDTKTNHLQLELAAGSGMWWIFKPHWDIDDQESNKDMSDIDRLISRCKKYSLTLAQAAYVMATIQHETNGTYKPVEEAYWMGKDWIRRNYRNRYGPGDWWGRGFTQFTWEKNYKKIANYFNRPDVLTNPDVLLTDFELSADATIIGIMDGWFSSTGYGLPQYVNNVKKDYRRARQTVNVMDKADLVASYAVVWENKLKQLKY